MTLRAGKLPNETLARLLAGVAHHDPRVLFGPGVGRDAAVIDIGGGRVVVAKTDPITFATRDIGWYAVHVNANDVACMGAKPTWFMATALLPPGADDSLPTEIFTQLTHACGDLGIELIGGHTEVTAGLERPIVVGAMLGEAARDEIVTGENIQPGDRVLMTKGIAIEGTALLAREADAALRSRGLSEPAIAQAASMLRAPGISVVADARALCVAVKPKLMHDPTEGGIATALAEMAIAANSTLRIDLAAIPVYPETAAICDALSLDPLGLLASGALLAIVDPADYVTLMSDRTTATNCSSIGTVDRGAPRVILGDEDSATPFPVFARDELARFFESAGGEAGARTS